ncbi:MAG: hypothetical protein J2P45_13700 [Candidatus Dormibacteraeota bacterium]|nr:hypothetical protein [Candidatus Dormibacteraeota bacterium]
MSSSSDLGGRDQNGQPWQADPYAGMTDEELARELDPRLPDRNRVVWIRLPERLLQRARQVAEREGVPYEGLIRKLLESSLERLDKGS